MAKHTPTPSDITWITEDAVFEGTVRAVGDLRIDGRVVGAVQAEQRVVIAANGYVEGCVTANTADVAGQMDGDVYATERLVLRNQASMQGDIQAPSLMVEEGAVFSGTCRMRSTEAASIAAPKAPPATEWAKLEAATPGPIDEVAEEVQAAEPINEAKRADQVDAAILADIVIAQVNTLEEDGADHQSRPADEIGAVEEAGVTDDVEADGPVNREDQAGAVEAAEPTEEAEASAAESVHLAPVLSAAPAPPKPISVAYWDKYPAGGVVAAGDEALEEAHHVPEATSEAVAPVAPKPVFGKPKEQAPVPPAASEEDGPEQRMPLPSAPARSMPHRSPEPSEIKTSVHMSAPTMSAPMWGRGTGLLAVMVVLLLLGGYFGIHWMRNDEALPPPEGIPQQPVESSVAPVADASAEPEHVEGLEPTSGAEPDSAPKVEEEAARQNAEQEHEQMEQARLRVDAQSREAEGASPFQEAEAARQTGLQQFEAGAFERASRSFRQARNQYALVRQQLEENDPATEEAAAGSEVLAAEETNDKTEEEAAPDAAAEVETAEADNSAAVAEVQAVSRRLSTYLKSNLEGENLGGMQALFYRGWEPFFEEAERITATVRTGEIEVDGTRARVGAQVELAYRDQAGEPQQQTRRDVWELTRMNGDWVLTRVVAQR